MKAEASRLIPRKHTENLELLTGSRVYFTAEQDFLVWPFRSEPFRSRDISVTTFHCI